MKLILTTTEYLEWQQYFRWEDRRRTKLDYYLAQIADEIDRANPKFKRTRRANIERKLLKFKDDAAAEAGAERMRKSKAAWAGLLGVKME